MGKIRRLGEKSIREVKLSVIGIQPQRGSIERCVTFEIPLVGPSDDTASSVRVSTIVHRRAITRIFVGRRTRRASHNR